MDRLEEGVGPIPIISKTRSSMLNPNAEELRGIFIDWLSTGTVSLTEGSSEFGSLLNTSNVPIYVLVSTSEPPPLPPLTSEPPMFTPLSSSLSHEVKKDTDATSIKSIAIE